MDPPLGLNLDREITNFEVSKTASPDLNHFFTFRNGHFFEFLNSHRPRNPTHMQTSEDR